MKQEISVPIAPTPGIKRPADSGNSGGTSAGQLKDQVGSSDEHDDEYESEDEFEEDPPAVINKSKKSSFSWELASLDGNLCSAWEPPVGSLHWKSQMIITVGGVNWKSRVQQPTDQSRPKP